MSAATLPPGFAAKVRQTECMVWIGATNSKGYGLVTVEGTQHLAHRVAYEAEYGPIPEGHVLDHLCRVRNCVNPTHLQPVTIAENNRRGRAAAALAVGDTCTNGHLIGEDDLYIRPSGPTECRQCRRASQHRPRAGRPTRQRRAEKVAADLDKLRSTA
ncbi:MAG TPA: HNH endonuclease signature motif containing protein [Acidimicrobiales bacterium]|nr:HNH endonuclease signature motif containing protein [Acidimicrobiales bacterium]